MIFSIVKYLAIVLSLQSLFGARLLEDLFQDRPFQQPIDTYAQAEERQVPRINERPQATVHEVTLPKSYQEGVPTWKDSGEKRGYPKNTLLVDDYEFTYTDVSEDELGGMDEILDANGVARVGDHGMQSFFGHYYDLTGTGVFNALVDYDLIYPGAEVIVTDDQGYSKGYEVTDTFDLLHADQYDHFYGYDHLPTLAFHGNGLDQVYIQYCRWDLSLGLLIGTIAYRIW